jgi:NAD(P)-dependent dehydrogenase (short-subunit alcohol dehydrogenase family)
MFRLDGKTALVTGASRGIGRAGALALAKAGAQVLVHYGSNQAEADAVVVLEAAEFGFDRPEVNMGALPCVHTQHGSPISRPFDWPSPSESAWHSALVHLRPAARRELASALVDFLLPFG